MSGDIVFNRPNEQNLTTAVFYGLNKGERIPDGYFQNIHNMTSSDFPCLSVREERANVVYSEKITAPGEPCDVINFNGSLMLCCSNGMIMYKDKVIDGLSLTKGLVPVGNKVFCYPSGILIDKDFQSFKYASLYYNRQFNVSLCDSSFNDIDKTVYSPNVPERPSNGQLWYDSKNNGLYKYSESQGEWAAVPQVYVKISSSEFNDYINFNEGDALSLGFSYSTDDDSDSYEMETFVSSVESNYITVEGTLPNSGFIGNCTVQIERKLPTLQHAVFHNNRVWGCFYDGSLNEIYSSKLGDPLSWYCYRGLSTDSYAVSCGESGEFTGCSELGDGVVFFKENCIYTVYGTEPSNYQTVKTDCFGVQKGSEKSICKINGQLYYKSCHGIMRLSEGSLPVCISDEIGSDIWKDAIAGTDGRKYYIVMTDIKGNREMFVYDTKYEMWHKEDVACKNLCGFIYLGNNLLCIGKNALSIPAKEIRKSKLTEDMAPKKEDFSSYSLYVAALLVFVSALHLYKQNVEGKTDGEIKEFIALRDGKNVAEVTDAEFNEFISTCYEIIPTYMHSLTFSYITKEKTCNCLLPVTDGSEYKLQDEGRFHWECETGLRGLTFTDYKRLKSVLIKMKLHPGARCDVLIEYDGRGEWESIGSFDKDGVSTFRIYDRFNKCDTYRLKFRGYGRIVVYSITEIYEEAGNIGF